MNCRILIVFTFLTIYVSTSFAATDEEKRFKKCYAMFTSRQVSADHTLMMQVSNESKTGADACIELLATANLGEDDTIGKNDADQYDREQQRIFQNIHFMHRSFFQVKSWDELSDIQNLSQAETRLFDRNNDAYYWDNALFNPGVKASDIVTANIGYRSIRQLPEGVTQDEQKILGLTSGKTSAATSYEVWQGVIEDSFVDQGLLVGVTQDTRSFYPEVAEHYWFNHKQGHNANKHFGAGVIGSQVYMFGNFGRHGVRERSTGGDKMFRRWSQHVLGDLLCKDLPALRIEDVTSEVDSQSPFFYRKSASCMQCHSTMDPMAAYARNLEGTGVSTAFRPFFVHEYEVTEPALSTILPADTDESFYNRPPDGRLMYRSYDGTLVSQTSTGMASLGELLADSNDFYACTAKKYYLQFTGIDVDLNDIDAPQASPLSPISALHRQRVIDLGQQLKADPTQNIQSIIKEIISTPTFIYPENF